MHTHRPKDWEWKLFFFSFNIVLTCPQSIAAHYSSQSSAVEQTASRSLAILRTTRFLFFCQYAMGLSFAREPFLLLADPSTFL